MDEQRNNITQTKHYSFRPSVGGRIRFFLYQLMFWGVINLFLFFGAAWLSEYFHNDALIFLSLIPIAITLIIILWRTVRSPSRFELSYDSMTATSGGKSREFLMEDNYVTAETMTTYFYGIPFASRKMVVTPKNLAPKEKPITINLFAYNRKRFAQLMSATTKIADFHDAAEREKTEEITPTSAPASPVIRSAETEHLVDGSLNRSGTYVIVTEPAELVQKGSLPALFFMLFLGIGGFAIGVTTDEMMMKGIGIAVFFFGLVFLILRLINKIPKNSMLGAEITPSALTINIKGDNQQFPWEQITAIHLTPLSYSGNTFRTISLTTPTGKYNYVYGTENNQKLNKNYGWLIEYLKLHALDKIEYLYR